MGELLEDDNSNTGRRISSNAEFVKEICVKVLVSRNKVLEVEIFLRKEIAKSNVVPEAAERK
jgi:hypothetical protein